MVSTRQPMARMDPPRPLSSRRGSWWIWPPLTTMPVTFAPSPPRGGGPGRPTSSSSSASSPSSAGGPPPDPSPSATPPLPSFPPVRLMRSLRPPPIVCECTEGPFVSSKSGAALPPRRSHTGTTPRVPSPRPRIPPRRSPPLFGPTIQQTVGVAWSAPALWCAPPVFSFTVADTRNGSHSRPDLSAQCGGGGRGGRACGCPPGPTRQADESSCLFDLPVSGFDRA